MRVTRRQRILLSLLDMMGDGLTSLHFQKLLFCFSRLEQAEGDAPSFEFLPHVKGGYSFTAHYEQEALSDMELMTKERGMWRLRRTDFSAASGKDLRRLHAVVEQLGYLSEEELVQRVYIESPEYAVRSTIVKDVLREFPAAMAAVQRCKQEEAGLATGAVSLFTIGYEGLSIEEFFRRLQLEQIDSLIDVRRVPFSHKLGFSRGKLEQLCEGLRIQYRHMPELGIPPQRRRSLNSQADYDALFEEYRVHDLPRNEAALQRIGSLVSRGQRVALMCFEADPFQCHRRIVANRIEEIFGLPYRNLLSRALPLCQPLLAF